MSCEKQCGSCPVIKNLDLRIGRLNKLNATNPYNPNVAFLEELKGSLLLACDPVLAEAAQFVREKRLVPCQSTFEISEKASFLMSSKVTGK